MTIGNRLMLGVGLTCAWLAPALRARADAGDAFAGDVPVAIALVVLFAFVWRAARGHGTNL